MSAPASSPRRRARRAGPAGRDAAIAMGAIAIAAIAAAVIAIGVFLISANDGIEDRARVGESTYAPSRGHKTPNPISSVRVVTSGGEIATGFAVGRDRFVTVAHVIVPGHAEAVAVDGARARVVRVDRRSDLALLVVPGGPDSGHAPVVAPDSAPAGSRLRLLRFRDGRPSSLSIDVRRPIAAHVRAAGAEHAVTRPALELTARVSPGDSGAPLVSESGQLAGVIFAASRTRENTAYAVDASAVARLIAPR